MVVVEEATLVNDNLGLPARHLVGRQRDVIGEEDFPRVRQGDDATQTFYFVGLLWGSRRGMRSIRRSHAWHRYAVLGSGSDRDFGRCDVSQGMEVKFDFTIERYLQARTVRDSTMTPLVRIS